MPTPKRPYYGGHRKPLIGIQMLPFTISPIPGGMDLHSMLFYIVTVLTLLTGRRLSDDKYESELTPCSTSWRKNMESQDFLIQKVRNETSYTILKY